MKWLLLAILLTLTLGHCSRSLADGKEKLLIVTPSELSKGLKEFAEFKSSVRQTQIVTLESILESNDNTGVDEPEKLKRFLYKQWRENDVGYVLLVGDASVMPIRYMVLDRVTEPAYHYAFYPSDLYYADLAKDDGTFEDWNGNKDGFHGSYFGEVRGEHNKTDPINFDSISYVPEIAVGRWPVESIEEVKRIATKSIRYERAVINQDRDTKNNSHIQRVGFVAVGGWVDMRPLFDRLIHKLESNWVIEKRFFADKNNASAEIPTREEVTNMFRKGMGLIVHAGHGQPHEWEQCFSIKDIDSLSNAQKLPIVLSAGCSTAYFATLPPYEAYRDSHGMEHLGTNAGEVFQSPPPPPAAIQKGLYNPTGLGEQLLRRNEDGAVAYIGCNTGSQPCGLTLVDGFISTLAQSKNPTLGNCWIGAVSHYHTTERLSDLKPNSDWYPPSIFFQAMKFMVFGDPSLPLATSSASDLN